MGQPSQPFKETRTPFTATTWSIRNKHHCDGFNNASLACTSEGERNRDHTTYLWRFSAWDEEERFRSSSVTRQCAATQDKPECTRATLRDSKTRPLTGCVAQGQAHGN